MRGGGEKKTKARNKEFREVGEGFFFLVTFYFSLFTFFSNGGAPAKAGAPEGCWVLGALTSPR